MGVLHVCTCEVKLCPSDMSSEELCCRSQHNQVFTAAGSCRLLSLFRVSSKNRILSSEMLESARGQKTVMMMMMMVEEPESLRCILSVRPSHV